jgi:hypothetical protein
MHGVPEGGANGSVRKAPRLRIDELFLHGIGDVDVNILLFFAGPRLVGDLAGGRIDNPPGILAARDPS